jgi:hypothetical protein
MIVRVDNRPERADHPGWSFTFRGEYRGRTDDLPECFRDALSKGANLFTFCAEYRVLWRIPGSNR